MPKILILTSKTGGGHVSLAEALRDQFTHDFAVEIVDPQPSLIHKHYRLVSRHALWLWAAEFKMADTPRRSLLAHKLFAALLGQKVSEVLLRSQPDLVIATYSFLTYEVTQAMKRIGLRCPFVMLFSDPYSVHCSWLTERQANATFAPTHETYMQALAAGFTAERLHFTGWPVRHQFYGIHNGIRAETLARLGLRRDRFTVFLQGGGEGAARFARTVEDLLTVPNIQIIVAAGTNNALVERFSGIDNVRPLAFTKEIAPFMAATDVVMGKAGPNMLFESVTLGKPFIATTYIPGQEELNLKFIQRHRLGWVALGAQEQRELIQTLASESAQLHAMRETVCNYKRQNTEATQTLLPLTKSVLGLAQSSQPAPKAQGLTGARYSI